MQKLELEENTILVVPKSMQKKIVKLLGIQSLQNTKVMTLEELRKKFYFDYDKRAIYYLMQQYHYQYDVAKMYLSRLYEVDKEDFGSAKIRKIIELKEELATQQLLIYQPLFSEYLKTKSIALYQVEPLSRVDRILIEELRNFCPVYSLNQAHLDYNHECIYEFDTIENEVCFVASKICTLVKQGVQLKNIKLCNASGEYSSIICRVFEWFHIPIQFNNNCLYATTIGQDFLNNLEHTAEDSLKYLVDHYSLQDGNFLEIYNKIIRILNNYTWVESLIEVKDFLIEDFKKEAINTVHYQEEVAIIETLLEVDEEDYVFLLGFNQGEIPKTYKDEGYFNDTLKAKLQLDTTVEQNKQVYQQWLTSIRSTKNLIITAKKTSSLGIHYISSLNDELQLNVKQGNIEFLHSDLFNQLILASKIDTLVKYNEKEDNLELLYTHYPNIAYGMFRSNYQQIDKEKLLDYMEHQLVLSYSSMNAYYQCAFRYYLANVLKLNIYEETFHTVLGNLFHYILSICFKRKINIKEEYKKYLIKCNYSFNSREKFFLNRLERELEFVIEVIQDQQKMNSLQNSYVEERIVVSKDISNTKVSFKGFVDKLFVNDTGDIISIVDYKTGNPDLNLNHVIYGLDLQLPVYIYLARKKFPNARIAGFYLQKIVNNEISRDNKHTYKYLKEEKLKLQGYSNSDIAILEQFDSSYCESKVIKGMHTTSKGIASKKILDDNQINRLEKITEQKIEEATEGILNARFEINPKQVGMSNLGCKYCTFKDICYRTETNIEYLKEYKNMEFLGSDQDDTKETC